MRTLDAVAAEAAGCRACDLWERATQTVFGEGPSDARMALVGEQPGDREDRSGRPFVGPSGRLLDEAVERAGLDREGLYVTNAVKHFKFTERGKRRIHDRPDATEIVACRRWIETELELIAPAVVVLMGTVAIRSVLGRPATITSLRGEVIELDHGRGVATVHPSAVLRAGRRRDAMFDGLVDDLRLAGELVGA